MDWFFLLSVILSILSIVGAVMNVYKIRIGFLLWIASNIGWTFWDIHIGAYGQIPIWITFTIISAFGYIYWGKDKKCSSEKITETLTVYSSPKQSILCENCCYQDDFENCMSSLLDGNVWIFYQEEYSIGGCNKGKVKT